TAKTVFGNAAEVHKVFVTNMHEARDGRGMMNPSNMNKHLGALGVFANLQYAAANYAEKDSHDRDENTQQALRDQFGDDNYKRWAKEQGYAVFDRKAEGKTVSELRKIAMIGSLSDIYGKDEVFDLLKDKTSYWKRGL